MTEEIRRRSGAPAWRDTAGVQQNMLYTVTGMWSAIVQEMNRNFCGHGRCTCHGFFLLSGCRNKIQVGKCYVCNFLVPGAASGSDHPRADHQRSLQFPFHRNCDGCTLYYKLSCGICVYDHVQRRIYRFLIRRRTCGYPDLPGHPGHHCRADEQSRRFCCLWKMGAGKDQNPQRHPAGDFCSGRTDLRRRLFQLSDRGKRHAPGDGQAQCIPCKAGLSH